MHVKKYGIFKDLFPTSDLEFMREAALDPGDGRGSYSERDKMLMLQFKVAAKGDRKALIWLIRHLTFESKARMTLRKKTQTITIRENPQFLSPAPALDLLDIAWLQLVSIDLKKWLCPLSEDEDSQRFQSKYPWETNQWRAVGTPIGGHIEPWFLEAAFARKQCPVHAKQQIENWLGNGALQPLHKQSNRVALNPLAVLSAPKRTPEDCWFKPGQSGNPGGRPKGSKNKSKQVRRDFFDEVITVTEGGKQRRLKRRVVFLRRVQAKAIAEQDHEIVRLLLDRHIVMSKVQVVVPYEDIERRAISIAGVHPNSLEGAIEALGGGKLLYTTSAKSRMLLEPWVLEMGFDRLGERHLSTEEQRVVLMFARHPRRTKWPAWWDPSLRTRGRAD